MYINPRNFQVVWLLAMIKSNTLSHRVMYLLQLRELEFDNSVLLILCFDRYISKMNP